MKNLVTQWLRTGAGYGKKDDEDERRFAVELFGRIVKNIREKTLGRSYSVE